jgi:NADPH-dependent curcumin reductase CurA
MADTYRKVVIHRLTGEFRTATGIVETARVAPGPGEVLVRNRYAGVNAIFDQNLCRNTIRYVDVVPPYDMGVEAIGEVVEVGARVEGFSVGDAVTNVKLGAGYREYQVADAGELIRVREPTPEILALMASGISAMVALERIADMKHGETIAVSAAAGGLGHFVVQLAKRAGNHVIALTGSDHKADLLRELGADRVVNYRSESLREVLEREYPRGIDIAYDSVGGEIFDAFLDHLAKYGRLIISGHTSDFDKPIEDVPHPRAYHKLYWKSASIRAFQNPAFPQYFDDAAHRILDLYYRGEVRALVDPTPFVGLEAAADAVEYLLAGRNAGKVVLRL